MIDPSTILGVGSAGIGAVVQMLKQSAEDRHNITLAALGVENNIANDANKRGSNLGRRFALIIVLSVGFGGLMYAAWKGIPVSQIIETQPLLDLLGIIKIGGGPKVIEATGFVIPEYVDESIISIIFFLFGSSAAKR